MGEPIVIACGDPTGIGPEIVLKAIAAELPLDDARYILFGDWFQLVELNQQLGLGVPLQLRRASDEGGRVLVDDGNVPALSPRLPHGAPTAANAAISWLDGGAQLCLTGQARALVTAPLSKEAVIRAGHPTFVGQTEYLSDMAGTHQTAMMLLGTDHQSRWLRVALATTHVPLRRVAETLTEEKIERAVLLAAQACRDLGLSRARVAVCGLNPHAGEGGEMGTEEIKLIAPALERVRKLHPDVVGPLAADTLFYQAIRGDYDAVVAMYHDQGLAPLKLVAFENGVNWTLGLPFVRTSPDHGTAYDIAGQNRASPISMISALRMAKWLVRKPAGAGTVG